MTHTNFMMMVMGFTLLLLCPAAAGVRDTVRGAAIEDAEIGFFVEVDLNGVRLESRLCLGGDGGSVGHSDERITGLDAQTTRGLRSYYVAMRTLRRVLIGMSERGLEATLERSGVMEGSQDAHRR